VRESEEMKRQIEEDTDREILTLKTSYEGKLKDEKVALHVSLSYMLLVSSSLASPTC